MHFLLSMARRLQEVLSRRKTVRLVALFGLAGTVGLLLPSPAHAQGGFLTGLFGIGSILGGAIGWVAFVFSYIVTSIVGFFISIVVYGIGIMLELNTHIVDTVAVQTGFQVTLSIANLGFVLGIIIIAMATIVRYETYGIKQLLSKLIIAALLVNFSLVIAGSIINFSDQLTNVFLSALPGGGGGAGGFHEFAKAFGGAFNPQRALLNPMLSQAGVTTDAKDLQKIGGAGAAGQSIGAIITPLISLVFAAAVLLVICITIATFFFMLLIRYIYLGMLLILMPMAWLLWIFPNTKDQWTKWWDRFLKWTFFAPISMFFLWLVIITSEKMSQTNGSDPLAAMKGLGLTAANDTSFLTGLSNMVLGGASNTVGTFLQAAVLVGLSLGGLIAAEKFSITGAHAAMGAVKGIGHAASGYAGRRMKQLAGKTLQKARVPSLATKLLTGTYGEGSSNRAVRALHGVAKWTGLKLAGQKVGEALQSTEVGLTSGLVKDEGDKLKKLTANMSDEQKANLVPGANMPQKIALLGMAAKEGWVNKVDSKYYDPSQKPIFKRYGKEKVWEDASKASGYTSFIKPYLDAMQAAAEEARRGAEKEAEALGMALTPQEQKDSEENPRKMGQVAYMDAIARGATKGQADQAEHDENWRIADLQIKKKKYEEFIDAKTEKAREEAITDEIDPETGKPTGKRRNAKWLAAREEERITELKKGDKVEYDKIFGGKEAFGLSKESMKTMAELFAEKMAYSNQQLIPQVVGKLNAKQLEGFKKLMVKTYDKGVASTSGDIKIKLEKGRDNLEKILAHNMTSHAHEEGGHGEEDHGEGGGEHAHGGGHAAPPPPPPAGENHGSGGGHGGDHH